MILGKILRLARPANPSLLIVLRNPVAHPIAHPPHSQDTMTTFHSHFEDVMEMYAPPDVVSTYLDAHEEWFPRSAKPMKVNAIGTTGYALSLGRFGALGYELEPKIGLNLMPQDHGVYRICTIPVPGYVPQGYDVDFQAELALVESPHALESSSPSGQPDAIRGMTRAEWFLDLTVRVQFPAFIHLLPDSLVRQTGEALLQQIVRQISRRLTHKVQEDFHISRGLPVPKPRWFF